MVGKVGILVDGIGLGKECCPKEGGLGDQHKKVVEWVEEAVEESRGAEVWK